MQQSLTVFVSTAPKQNRTCSEHATATELLRKTKSQHVTAIHALARWPSMQVLEGYFTRTLSTLSPKMPYINQKPDILFM